MYYSKHSYQTSQRHIDSSLVKTLPGNTPVRFIDFFSQ